MLIVDRIEGKYALCERDDGKMQKVLLEVLPKCIKDGSVLNLRDGSYYLDEIAYEKRKNDILNLQNKLFKK